MFRSQLFDHLQGGRLSCLVLLLPSLLICVVKLFIWYVAVCCLCVCVPDVLVCGMFGCDLVTETCRVLMMCFTNIFNNLEF